MELHPHQPAPDLNLHPIRGHDTKPAPAGQAPYAGRHRRPSPSFRAKLILSLFAQVSVRGRRGWVYYPCQRVGA